MDYLRSAAKNFKFCRVSKIGTDGDDPDTH